MAHLLQALHAKSTRKDTKKIPYLQIFAEKKQKNRSRLAIMLFLLYLCNTFSKREVKSASEISYQL